MAGTENLWTNVTEDNQWDTDANWSRGAAPVDDDDVVLNATAQGSITGGFVAATGVDLILNSFVRMPDYTGDVGTSGSPCRFATVNDTSPINPLDPTGKAIIQGPGKFFFETADGVGTNEDVDYMYVDTDNQSDVIELSGAIDNLHVIKGRVTGLAAFVPINVAVTYRDNPNSDAVLTLQNTASIGALFVNAGNAKNEGSGSTGPIYIAGGNYLHGKAAGSVTAIFLGGGTCVYNSAAPLASAVIQGGTLDMSKDGRAKTINFLLVATGGVYLDGPHVTITHGGSILPLTDIIP